MPDNFWVGAAGSVVFGLIGLLLLLGGFKLFDLILPKVNFEEKMQESPIACAIIIAAFLLAVAYIAGSVVH